jgi:GntR family uxuAB operon transcriptional repressor
MEKPDIAIGEADHAEPFQRAFEVVASKIAILIQQKYEISDRLPAERELAKRYGVSRPTVRESILQLSLSGMVEVRKNSGVYVKNRQQIALAQDYGMGPFESLTARMIVEPEVAALAASVITDAMLAQLAYAIALMRLDYGEDREAESADRRFHTVIAEATGNGMLVTVVDVVWGNQIRSTIWDEIHSQIHHRDFRAMWLEDHERIYDALKARNPASARAEMARHLRNARKVLLAESSPVARGRSTKRSNKKDPQ